VALGCRAWAVADRFPRLTQHKGKKPSSATRWPGISEFRLRQVA